MKEASMSIPAGKPHRAIPPSEILEDFLGEYGITQYRLAKETKIIGLQRKQKSRTQQLPVL